MAELEHEHFKQRARAANSEQARLDWNRYYCEIHVFVTRAPDPSKAKPLKPMVSAPKFVSPLEEFKPAFTADQLYACLMAPSVSSRKFTESMRSIADGKAVKSPSLDGKPSSPPQDSKGTVALSQGPANNLQDVWVWNGRPDWEQVFVMMRQQAVDPDIGVFVSALVMIPRKCPLCLLHY